MTFAVALIVAYLICARKRVAVSRVKLAGQATGTGPDTVTKSSRGRVSVRRPKTVTDSKDKAVEVADIKGVDVVLELSSTATADEDVTTGLKV